MHIYPKTPSQANDEVCSICLEALDELCFVGKCGHKHHALCLCEWYTQCEVGPKCPLCRCVVHRKEALRLLMRFKLQMDQQHSHRREILHCIIVYSMIFVGPFMIVLVFATLVTAYAVSRCEQEL